MRIWGVGRRKQDVSEFNANWAGLFMGPASLVLGYKCEIKFKINCWKLR